MPLMQSNFLQEDTCKTDHSNNVGQTASRCPEARCGLAVLLEVLFIPCTIPAEQYVTCLAQNIGPETSNHEPMHRQEMVCSEAASF